MSRGRGTISVGLFSLAILLGFALAADAETPWVEDFRPAPARKQASSRREQTPDDPLAQRPVMIRHIGFEAQQQGYLAKVQGAASQNVIWVTSHERAVEPSRKSRFASWWEFFSFWD
jgi:hypothetical protein